MAGRVEPLLTFEDTVYGSSTTVVRVPSAGFRWEGSDAPLPLEETLDGATAGRYLVQNDGPPDGPWGERVAPLRSDRVPRLAADFAALKTPEGPLRFANRWGGLGHPEPREWLATWEKETRRALALATVMGWLAKGDRERLRSLVTWNVGANTPIVHPEAAMGDRGGERWLGWRRIVEADVLTAPDGRPRWHHGDVVGPARFWVCDELNKAVKGHVQTKLMPFAEDRLFRLYVVPDCLKAVIFYQLQLVYAREVAPAAAMATAKNCERAGCYRTFSPRGNTRYCSPECRRWGRAQQQARWRASAEPDPTPITTPKLPQSPRTAADGHGRDGGEKGGGMGIVDGVGRPRTGDQRT